MINVGHLYMMFDFSGHMWSCAVWKSFNQLSSWWLLCKRYAYTLIRVSRHHYVIRMFLLCLCIFVSNKTLWSWSWSWRIAHRRWTYRQVSNIRRTKSQHLKILVLSCGCLCRLPWSQMLSREGRCSWSRADRRCSNYTWVIDKFIAY